MAPTDQAGVLQYVVDANPLPEMITAKSPTSFTGDKFDTRNDPEMLSAFNGPSADKDIVPDSWGVTLSGYAPIRDSFGKSVAILCVDIDVSKEYAKKKQEVIMIFFVILTGILSIITFVFSKGARNV